MDSWLIHQHHAISYPEPSLSGSGHTGLKNDPDWSIYWTHTPCGVNERGQYEWIWYILLYPDWKSTSFDDFLLLFVLKSGEGIRSWFTHTWINLGNRIYFVIEMIRTLGSLCFVTTQILMAYDVLYLLYWNAFIELNSSVHDLQAYTYSYDCVCIRFGSVQLFSWTVNIWIILV